MHKEINNCEYCGRDTTSKKKVCYRCQGYSYKPFATQNKDTKDRTSLSIEFNDPVLDDLEYTDYYKTNAPDADNGTQSTEKFIKRMNKNK